MAHIVDERRVLPPRPSLFWTCVCAWGNIRLGQTIRVPVYRLAFVARNISKVQTRAADLKFPCQRGTLF